ncbi:hypothetical protein GGR27_003606 [Lewinella antarctica]|uniref:Ribosomal protein S16 n=1 Tax=Neolewinella antarctica TaxID=442734 RepID=A0ABX0XFV9_9BACT|nr:hypothetical protein [Neolewinella antarctica]
MYISGVKTHEKVLTYFLRDRGDSSKPIRNLYRKLSKVVIQESPRQ